MAIFPLSLSELFGWKLRRGKMPFCFIQMVRPMLSSRYFQAYEAGLHRPRRDLSKPLTGVFSTRSPDRPSPRLHRVRAMKTGHLCIGPMEAIDGTRVIDIKPVVESRDY